MIDPGILAFGFLATMFAAWAGLIVGVSFLSARAKFLAPSITLRVALDVGRYTFRVLSRTDLMLAVAASLFCKVEAPSAAKYLVSSIYKGLRFLLVYRW